MISATSASLRHKTGSQRGYRGAPGRRRAAFSKRGGPSNGHRRPPRPPKARPLTPPLVAARPLLAARGAPPGVAAGNRAGRGLVQRHGGPARARVLGGVGGALRAPQVIAQSGSLSLLPGDVVGATAAEAKAPGALCQAGDLMGQGGIVEA